MTIHKLIVWFLLATTPHQIGMASWYGRNFAGRRTASGEKFNPELLTAAHRTLAFGTRVKITNLNNGKTVKVKINDRGPFVHGAIIDVSENAAQLLGFKNKGLQQVRIDLE